MDQSGYNGPNRTNVDHREPMSTEWTAVDQSGQNRTNVDKIEPMWTRWTKLDRSRLNKTYWTE